MKTTKLVLTLALSSMLLASGGLSSFAATGDGTTIGKVEFGIPDENSEGEITKPDTDEEIIEVEEGNNTKGPLRLTFVPNFDFGKMEVASDTKYGNAKFLEFNKKAETAKENIAHFVQVEDLRGGIADDWNVSVKATKFTGQDEAGATHTLENSVVKFNEASLFNTRLSAAEITEKVAIFTPSTTTNEVLIPNDNTGTVELMNTKADQGTNSSKTSLVFNNNYSHQDTVGGADVLSGNTGVQLKSVGKDVKLKDVKYTATLTWTLASTL